MLTAGNDYGVRVVVAYENRQVGQVFYPPGVLRQWLKQRGLVVDHRPEPASTPEAAEPDPGDEKTGRGRRKLGLLTK